MTRRDTTYQHCLHILGKVLGTRLRDAGDGIQGLGSHCDTAIGTPLADGVHQNFGHVSTVKGQGRPHLKKACADRTASGVGRPGYPARAG